VAIGIFHCLTLYSYMNSECEICLNTMLCRYPEARAIQRKIVYHAGPTNSGKTHHALERFMNAKSGVYCGPLRLLAVQVFQKLNDLVSVNLLTVFLLLLQKDPDIMHAEPFVAV